MEKKQQYTERRITMITETIDGCIIQDIIPIQITTKLKRFVRFLWNFNEIQYRFSVEIIE